MALHHPGFFARSGPFSLAELASAVGAELNGSSDVGIGNIGPLDTAGPSDVCFLDNKKYRAQLQVTRAGACLVRPADRDLVPTTTIALVTREPYRAFAQALALFYPDALRGAPVFAAPGDDAVAPAVGPGGGLVHPTASLEDGVIVEPGAVVGAQAQIGAGARICAGAVVGYRCTIGRNTTIGPGAVIVCSLIGDRVLIQPGVKCGQDGFGFAMSARGHLKVPQVGRVIIQDDVEIGAGTTLDRGALNDTVIGEGTKIDNLVQIGHNVTIGRHCVIVAQVGISGSTSLGDFVVMGGQSGTVGHVRIGDGAQIAGAAHVKNDVPPGARMGGTPAVPIRQWAREVALLRRLVKEPAGAHRSGAADDGDA